MPVILHVKQWFMFTKLLLKSTNVTIVDVLQSNGLDLKERKKKKPQTNVISKHLFPPNHNA